MNSVFRQLAFAAGALLFLLALGLGLLNGVSIPTALFRATAVMAIGTIVIATFFRFFTAMVFEFVNERVSELRRQRAAAAQQAAAPGASGTPQR